MGKIVNRGIGGQYEAMPGGPEGQPTLPEVNEKKIDRIAYLRTPNERGKFKRPLDVSNLLKRPITEAEKIAKAQQKAQQVQADEIDASLSQEPQRRGKKMSVASSSPLGGSGSLL